MEVQLSEKEKKMLKDYDKDTTYFDDFQQKSNIFIL